MCWLALILVPENLLWLFQFAKMRLTSVLRDTQREARSLPLSYLGNPPRVTCRRMNISARNLPLVNRTVMCAHAQLPNQLCLPTLPTWDKCENRTCAAKRDFWKNDRWKGQVRNCPSWSFSTTTTSYCPCDCCFALLPNEDGFAPSLELDSIAADIYDELFELFSSEDPGNYFRYMRQLSVNAG